MASSPEMSTSNQYIVYNIECTESPISSDNIARNYSTVHVVVDCWRTNGYSTWGTGTCYCRINGDLYSQPITSSDVITSSGVHLFEEDVNIPHNPDGTKTLTISAWIEHSEFSSSEQSWDTPLTTIPRYANLTKLEVKSRTVNSITLSYTTDKAAWLFAKVNDGEWLNGGEPFKSNTTSGEFTIYYKNRASTQRLDVNTSYKITVLCRAISRDSELDTQRDITTSTYDIAKISSASNFDHGSNDTVVITNPSGATATLVMKIGNTQILSKTVSVGNNTISFTDTNLDTIYKLYGTSSSLTVTYIVSITVNSTSYTNSKTCTITLKGTQKTARTNVSNSWKRGYFWTNVNGTWKRAVIWTNVNGSWKRCA